MKNQIKFHSLLTVTLLSLSLMLVGVRCAKAANNAASSSVQAKTELPKPIYKGPYTINVLAEGVYHIEDANESRPAGMTPATEGRAGTMNNCSDMYLVVGKDKALLIDLSNAIRWAGNAAESLRSIVYERAGNKELYITITHNHGDHTGMLPAFADETKAKFWIPKAEFANFTRFPQDRTTNFDENASFDLGGGFVINTMEVPGHTAHSTIFFLKDKNLVFTGDALGSGTGVWLFNYDSFITYIKGVENLIKYIENPANNIDREKLVIHGGHAWQKGQLEKLSTQYVYDMKTLIEKIGQGAAETTRATSSMASLDTNFKYGTATITWNKASADKYAESLRAGSGN
jgi:glyoxylase-like metal-dependent hydrolase (beta-lactamase superfamily II)